MAKTKVAIIGSGNIGTDLMIKIMRSSQVLEMGALVGIDPESDGLARAKRLGVPVTDKGIEGLMAMPEFRDIEILFDATSAKAHLHNDRIAHAVDIEAAGDGEMFLPETVRAAPRVVRAREEHSSSALGKVST